MGVQYDSSRRRFVVRWREDGKQRCRRFASQTDAEEFDAEVNPNGRANQPVVRAREAAERRIAGMGGPSSEVGAGAQQ